MEQPNDVMQMFTNILVILVLLLVVYETFKMRKLRQEMERELGKRVDLYYHYLKEEVTKPKEN